MLCHQCGSPLSAGAERCDNCGAESRTRSSSGVGRSSGLERYTQRLKAINPEDVRLFPRGEVVDGRFEVGDLIGRGPFGETYRARDREIETEVVIKAFQQDLLRSPVDQERYLEALKSARNTMHRNLVRLLEGGVHNEHGWVSMQYLEGLSLQKVIDLRHAKQEHFEPDEVEPIVAQIVDALKALGAENGHGNLKPSNVIMLPSLVKVTDYFLLSALSPDVTLRRLVGQGYVAPELQSAKRGKFRTPNVRSDVFSLGGLLGELFFASTDPVTQAGMGRRDVALVDLCQRARAPRPQDRFPDLDALMQAFYAATGLRFSSVPLADFDGSVTEQADLMEPNSAEAGGRNGGEEAYSRTRSDSSGHDGPPPPPSGQYPALQAGPPTSMRGTPDRSHLTDHPGRSEFDELATTEVVRENGTELTDYLPTTEYNRDDHSYDVTPKPVPAEKAATSAPVASTRSSERTESAMHVQPTPKAQPAENPAKLRTIWIVAVTLVLSVSATWWVATSVNRNGNDVEPQVVRIGDEPAASDRAESSNKPESATGDAPHNDAVRAQRAVAALQSKVAEAALQARQEHNDLSESGSVADGAGPNAESSDTSGRGSRAALPASTTTSRGASASSGRRSPREGSAAAKSNATECPAGMVLVKRSAGAFCIDRFEFPGRGVRPRTNVSWFAAKKACESEEKRLCELGEWRRACGSTYPYGGHFSADRCNTQDADGFERSIATAGEFKRCRSRSGAMDMTGNVHEWVAEQKIVGGGYDSGEDVASCRYASAKAAASAAPYLGFRCCADPSAP